MPRFALTIEYDGTHYVGWQRQHNGVSIQQVVEEALDQFCQGNPILYAAGRTDAGVHATGQVAHFNSDKNLDPYRIVMGLNAYLREHPIRIIEARQVDDTFHARFSATSRSYTYKVLNRIAPPGIDLYRVTHVGRKLDLELMQETALQLIGRHDFSTFRAQACQAKSPIRTLTDFKISRQNEYVLFDISAQSFLHHQVRNMVGSLLYVGTGKWTQQQFEDAFKAAERKQGGPTAPPDGLYLTGVFY